MYSLKITEIEYFIRLRLDPNAVKNRYLLDHFEERLEQRKKSSMSQAPWTLPSAIKTGHRTRSRFIIVLFR